MNPCCFLIPLFLLNQNPGSKARVGRFKDWNMALNDRYLFFFLLTQVENTEPFVVISSHDAWILLLVNSVGTPFLCKRFLLL